MANIDFEQKLDFLLKGLRFKALFSYKTIIKPLPAVLKALTVIH